MAQKIILDTDIGDDVDDALALALICASPELELVGVTTVFGNAKARARQARTILKIAGEGFAAIPVAAGCGASMASRPVHDNRAARDYLNGVLPIQDATCLPESDLAPLHPQHGVDFLIETILGGDGDIIPITIGALTNLAMALVKAPEIAAKIPRIIAMAGEFRTPMAEWNIKCDPEAAHIVFGSGIPMQITPWHIGRVAQFGPEHIAQLQNSERPMASNLGVAIIAWQDGGRKMPALYDPHAVATLIEPQLAQWQNGTVRVELQGQHTYGFTRIDKSQDGPHRIAWDTDRETSLDFYLKRVLAF